MNNERRKRLDKVMEQLETCKGGFPAIRDAVGLLLTPLADRLESLEEELTEIKDEEQEAFDNLPEGLQQAERGQSMEAAIEQLDSAIQELCSLREAVTLELPEDDSFDNVVTHIDEAKVS